ncbi:pantoate--beta-alanine ligase [Listeria welshimeri]|uniref:Pantothenate synthetase n=1 Tax=Listeria welshimeri serovar 6b (strain ATCC 35897 / DSM 20650 / CCUG 15529 / CIP 8149 / NCTC 11857 / SLCC 5334 / V8) TaxID=386043 RepID=PANC_LISW6|nr:pantoate--beta-alanine ligase [Listeria welshimeri]A0AK06.1 RecName: Full=Pantothenate synthetase; Short=PS; AltName: Full=Pantoate--beta-alanine ligase; AltName: Full=Pantoate-activating enzyme [Listeria welshimeri serovar 6b str. SLCC5334]MBC1349280.1 pantoate--beta-alanine ligase [Listeria welshimeri]CAK21338.1 pantoate--beta-alanine ligase [Listeria welshimeri serovar 6b str. SLCC5334]SNV26544.1 Pantothenate synthetase [Listeria welshimeri]
MLIIRNKQALKEAILKETQVNKTIGFVPTMGFLHEGHMTLVKHARKENDVVVMSVFVNPTQFGPNEDFDAYPRDEAHDAKLAEEGGVDILFVPSVEEIYPVELATKLHVIKRVSVLDGADREGHFDGVVTVLTKLFHLVNPNNAYFGQKDAQQVAVVSGLVEDYFFPVNLRIISTVRETDGLAKSSRNVYLTDKERKEAPVIHAALQLGRQLIESGETDETKIVQMMTDKINEQTAHEKIAYLALYAYPDFTPVTDWSKGIIIAAAVKYSKARLIDNELINVKRR